VLVAKANLDVLGGHSVYVLTGGRGSISANLLDGLGLALGGLDVLERLLLQGLVGGAEGRGDDTLDAGSEGIGLVHGETRGNEGRVIEELGEVRAGSISAGRDLIKELLDDGVVRVDLNDLLGGHVLVLLVVRVEITTAKKIYKGEIKTN